MSIEGLDFRNYKIINQSINFKDWALCQLKDWTLNTVFVTWVMRKINQSINF